MRETKPSTPSHREDARVIRDAQRQAPSTRTERRRKTQGRTRLGRG